MSRSTRLGLRVALCVALAMTLVDTVHAQSPGDVATARELAKEGLEANKAGRWIDAISAFERSLALHRNAFTLYNLGVAYRSVGKNAQALESFRQFLKEPMTEAMQPFEAPAKAAIAELEGVVAHVTITVTPGELEGLKVMVDDRRIPTAALGLPRLVDAGEHEVVVTAPGHLKAQQRFTVTEGGEAEVALTLEIDPSATPDAPEVEDQGSIVVPVVLMAVGGAALAAGIAVGLVGYNQAKDAQFNDDDDAKAGETKALVGDVLAIAGGVVGAAGLVWLIVELTADADTLEEAGVRPSALGIVVSF